MAQRRTTSAGSVSAEGNGAGTENAISENGAGDVTPGGDGSTGNAGTPSKTRRTRQPARRGRPSGKRTGRSDIGIVVEALLRSRASKGATAEDLQIVVSWAQHVEAEGEAIERESAPRRGSRSASKMSARAKAAADQQRQAQEEQLRARRSRHEMDRALLDGVLAGAVTLDVQAGQILFLHGGYQAAHATAGIEAAEAAATSAGY